MAAAPSPWWRSALLSALAGCALSGFGVLPFMGLPGALALGFAEPLLIVWHGVPSERLFPRDSAWPAAIMVTLALGPLVPLIWLVTRAAGLCGWRRAAVVTAGLALGSVAVALVTYALGVAPLLADAPR